MGMERRVTVYELMRLLDAIARHTGYVGQEVAIRTDNGADPEPVKDAHVVSAVLVLCPVRPLVWAPRGEERNDSHGR